MSWFTDRIGKLGRAGGAAVMERECNPADADPPVGPALVMLVADANGVASYRFHAYRDTEPARAFLKYWFPKDADTGVIAFWALTAEPEAAPDIRAEPMVLVRDVAKPGVIYPFSFLDMNSAQAFARQEVESGLGLQSVLIYWAATVRIWTDDCGVLQMSPSMPPACSSRPKVVVIQDDASATVAPAPAAPPTLAPAMERDSLTVFSAHCAIMKIAGPAKEVKMKKPAPRVLEEKPNLDKAVPEEFGGSVVTNGYSPLAEPTIDLEKQMLKVLQVKRWDTQEGPFRGINSPPGRF